MLTLMGTDYGISPTLWIGLRTTVRMKKGMFEMRSMKQEQELKIKVDAE